MIYYNFLYAPDGGGYQNSLSFVKSLSNIGYDFSGTTLLVYENSELHHFSTHRGIGCISIKTGVSYKLLFELGSRRFLKKDDVVFSLFGPPMLTTSGFTLNIGGMAISNVLHKDIDFWDYLNSLGKNFRRLKDLYRCWRYSKLDYWIFETELLAKKAINEYNFPNSRVSVVKMAPSALVTKKAIVNNSRYNYLRGNSLNMLFLSGAHPNKRIHVLPNLARSLREVGVSDFNFVLTCRPGKYLSDILESAKQLGVEKHFEVVGPVQVNDVATVIDCSDFVCTFSVLESFSNNFVEAWVMEKPLIVTEADWAKDACDDAALYVEPENALDSAKKIRSLFNSINNQKKLICNGKKMLKLHPTAEEKAELYLNYINRVQVLGKIDSRERAEVQL